MLNVIHQARQQAMTFDRAAILREAHAATRLRLVPSHSQRYGDRYDRELAAWVPKAGYRAIFAGRLRNAWHMARAVAASAALEASLPPVSDDVLAQADAIRAAAWFEPINGHGNARLAAAHLAAFALIENARYGAVL